MAVPNNFQISKIIFKVYICGVWLSGKLKQDFWKQNCQSVKQFNTVGLTRFVNKHSLNNWELLSQSLPLCSPFLFASVHITAEWESCIIMVQTKEFGVRLLMIRCPATLFNRFLALSSFQGLFKTQTGG